MTISIVTPSYNQAQYIERALNSILDGPCGKKVQIIIIDGGSTDDTERIVEKYKDQIDYFISEPDAGQSDALNKGLKRATGEILGWLNTDDYYEEGALKKVEAFFKDFKDANVLYGNCRLIGSDGNYEIIKPGKVSFYSLLRYWEPYFLPPQPSIFFRTAALKKFQFDVNLKYAMDLQLWLYLSKTSKFHYIDEVLSNYVVHEQSKTGGEGSWHRFYAEWKCLCENEIKKLPYWKQKQLWLKRVSQKYFGK